MSYINGKRTNTAMPTGNYDPRRLPVRVLFLLLFFSLPLLALAKASHPTNKYVKKRKTALKDTFCLGDADDFFFQNADRARSRQIMGLFQKKQVSWW